MYAFYILICIIYILIFCIYICFILDNIVDNIVESHKEQLDFSLIKLVCKMTKAKKRIITFIVSVNFS